MTCNKRAENLPSSVYLVSRSTLRQHPLDMDDLEVTHRISRLPAAHNPSNESAETAIIVKFAKDVLKAE